MRRYYESTIARRKTGLIYWDMDWSSGCYTLYAPQTGNGLVKLIDISGDTVHEWNLPVRPGRDAVILPNGNLGYNGSHEKSVDLYPAWDIWHGGHFMEATPSGDIVWEHEDPYHHHDAQWLDNGNLLYTVASPIPVKNGKGLFNSKVPLEMQQRPFSDTIREVNREGEVVWEWNVWEHISIEDYPIHECFNRDNAKERLHWPMVNGIHQTEDGLILLSLRTTSGIIAVDKETREIIWKLKYPLVAQQHDPSLTEDGYVLCFDNGNIRPASIHHSRIVEYDIVAEELVWEYKDPMPPAFFSPYMGSVEKLWNGSYSICESAFGRIFEVNPKGELMWEYVIPEFAEYPKPLNQFITGEHNSCFKTHRYQDNDILKILNHK
jgi:outer membrane protein assembly factor BamB